jgi:signal transduction histidine kinase
MRRHPVFGDSVITVVLALLTVTEATDEYAQREPVFFWLVGALMVLPVAKRRQWPVATAYVIMFGAVLQLLTHPGWGGAPAEPVRSCDAALAVALYTLVVYTDRRKKLVYAALLVIGMGIYLGWRTNGAQSVVVSGLLALAVFGFAWVLGEFLGARRAYHAEVEARVKLLETERDQQATIAVAAERTRIARELHDVVAHAVSVIVVQADGAGYAIRTDPDMAESAVRTISETGREALMELRRLLDVLRSDADERDSRAPQPDVSVLPELVDKVAAVGLPVSLNVRGDVSDLPAAVGLGIYRIVQEALTNSIKHAGAGAWATVRVERVGGLVEVEVADHGGSPAVIDAGPDSRARLVSVSGGNGLIGMRERATVLGGTLTAGRADGGWQVRATFPVHASHDTERV